MSEEKTPSWRYGPNDEAAIFADPDTAPKGWADHPSKVAKKDKPAAEPVDDTAVAAKAALAAARKAHKAKFGKLPGPKATLDEINAKLAASGD